MRLPHLAPLAAAALAAACASSGSQSSGPVTTPSPATSPYPIPAPTAATSWVGELRPENGTTVRGTVTIAPAATAGQSTAVVALTGAPANGTHPWHVHMGSCADKGAIVGPPAVYTPLSVDATGAARLELTLPFAPPTTGAYSVNVHMSPTQMGMIVACADLRTQS